MGVNAPLDRKLRMALVGGGQGAFIGKVHSIAAVLDNRAALVAGALSSDAARAKASAPDYDIKPERAYGSYRELIESELKLPESERIDFASVATPNHTHFEIAKAFAEAGFNVICDKPMTFDLAQAEDSSPRPRRRAASSSPSRHNYTGYPLVRQAREMIQAGELGEIQAVRAFYIQGWLRDNGSRASGQKQADWRTDPKRSGIAGCFGDIGTHAYNLGRFVTGLIPESDQSCHLQDAFEPGRALDDYGTAIDQASTNGASRHRNRVADFSHGRENDLWIEVDGTKGAHRVAPGGAEQDDRPPATASRTRSTREAAAPTSARWRGRPRRASPPGHPEAFLEAFANVYTAAYDAMVLRAAGKPFDDANSVYPNVFDGIDGMNFITQAVASSNEGGAAKSLAHPACRG